MKAKSSRSPSDKGRSGPDTEVVGEEDKGEEGGEGEDEGGEEDVGDEDICLALITKSSILSNTKVSKFVIVSLYHHYRLALRSATQPFALSNLRE